MANKILNTRIQLKYDTLTNWQSGPFNGTDNTKRLNAGKLAIVRLAPNKETYPTSKAAQHPLLFKVGTGSHKFDDLPWASALSADVYDWAKQSGIVINTTGNGDFITGITWDADNKRINVTKGSYTVTTSGTGAVITGISKSGTTITATKGNISYNDLTNKPTINNDNQTVKGNGTAFGSNAAIDIVPGSNVTITPDATKNKITISSSYTDTHQKVKAGTTTFGNNDTVEIKAGTNVTVTPDATAKTITIASTDTNDNQLVKAGDTTFGINDTVNFVAGTNMGSVAGDANKKTITINGKDWTSTINNAVNEIATAAMEFKGATSTLPSATSLRKGSTYKVTENITVAASADAQGIGFTAKLGDTIVYDGYNKWYLIPSGDDIEDTWRPVTGVNSNSSLTFAEGSKLDVEVKDNGTITYSHEAIAAPTETAGSSRKYLTGITTDGYGHITGYTTNTETDQELPVVNDGRFTVSGTGYLTGSGSMTANQATNTTANLDLTSATKKKIDEAVQTVTAGIGIKATKTGTTVNLEVVGKGETDDDGNEVVWILDCGGAQ